MNIGGGRKVLVIGVGNECRSDDGVGLVVVRRLAHMATPGVSVVESSGDATGLLESWEDAAKVILVDAVSSGDPPGTVHRVGAEGLGGLKLGAGVSTHGFSVGAAIRLAHALGGLPTDLVIYGIEGKNYDPRVGLSPEVEKAADVVLERILEEVTCTSTP